MKLFGTSNYIEIYDNVLSVRECEMIISAFEEGGPTPGFTSEGYEPDYKKSIDMRYSFTQSNKVTNIIYPNLIRNLKKYYKKYDDLLKNIWYYKKNFYIFVKIIKIHNQINYISFILRLI